MTGEHQLTTLSCVGADLQQQFLSQLCLAGRIYWVLDHFLARSLGSVEGRAPTDYRVVSFSQGALLLKQYLLMLLSNVSLKIAFKDNFETTRMAGREEMATCLLEMGFSDIEVDCALQATEFKVSIHFRNPASYFADNF